MRRLIQPYGHIEETTMRQPVTDSQASGGLSDQHPGESQLASAQNTLELVYPPMESPSQMDTQGSDNAREVAAQHFARLLYAPMNTWSRYIFHENDPYPYGAPRPTRRRG